MTIPFIRPVMPPFEEMAEDLRSIVDANWFSNFGPQERAFRRELEDYVGGDVAAVTMNNATTGLMAALAALLPRGDDRGSIAIASFTFAAGAQAIRWHGYRPAWFDVELDSLQPSLGSFRRLLDEDDSIRGILLTNTFGIGNHEIEQWEVLAAELALPLIIDSAAGFGSVYPGGERLGRRGDCEVFSFHATKPFAIGEGGAVTTRDHGLAERMREFTNFGFAAGAGANAIGLNGKLQELSAAIGTRQLTRYDAQLQQRRDTLRDYEAALAELPLRFPRGSAESSVCFASAVFDDGAARDAAYQALRDAGVDARQYYSPLVHDQPAFREFSASVELVNSEMLAGRVLSLPVISDMSDDEIETVASAIRANATSSVVGSM